MADAERKLVRMAFEEALAQPDAKRHAYLESAYRDKPSLVRAAKELLACHRRDTRSSNGDATTQPVHHVFQPGQIVAGRFRIVRFLGAGGMGQVYEADDEKIGVSVALKTLHKMLSPGPGVWQRLRREVRMSREVSHTNLCRVYDMVEHHEEGKEVTCLCMELLRGETLAEHIAKSRPLPLQKALELLRPIAEVLDLMHQRGIVHRDLKPSNVMLTACKGDICRVVVLDFGLAKRVEGGTALFESAPDAQAGSPYFMAPELWDGAQPSVASDVYAFGLIADEMVTKSPAFDTASLAAFYYSKFREGPAQPSSRGEHLPRKWDEEIGRCLSANPSTRPRSAMEMLRHLENAISGRSIAATSSLDLPPVAPLRLRTIAVMPFADLSPNRDYAYFCEGVTEELIHLLSQTASLRVISRASVFDARLQGAGPREVGRELGATHLLLGSVRVDEQCLRVTVQLVDAAEGCNLWSERFDRQLSDAFAIQEEVAAASLGLLKSGLDMRSPLLHLPRTNNPDAYQAYLEGLSEFNRQTPDAIRDAAACFERSATADSSFAPAYSGLADCWCAMEWYGLRSPRDAMPAAMRYAAHALELNRGLANAHCTAAVVRARYEWNWKGAEQSFRHTLALNPGLSRAHFAYALDYLTPRGHLEEALRTIRNALHLDPLSPLLHTAVGGCLYRMRQYGAALDSLRQTIILAPGFFHAHWSAGRVLAQLGRYQEAVSEFESAILGSPENPLIAAELGHCYGVMGWPERAESALRNALSGDSTRYVSPLCAAMVHLGLSARAEAMKSLAEAAEERPGALIWIAVDPRFDSLREEPQFRNILTTMGLTS